MTLKTSISGFVVSSETANHKRRMELHRQARRQAGQREVTVWVDDRLRGLMDVAINDGRFKNRSDTVQRALSELLEGKRPM